MPGVRCGCTFVSSSCQRYESDFLHKDPPLNVSGASGFVFNPKSENQNTGEFQNPGLVMAIVHSLFQEPMINNGLPRKVCYFSSTVRILRPQTRAMVGVLKVEVGIPRL